MVTDEHEFVRESLPTPQRFTYHLRVSKGKLIER